MGWQFRRRSPRPRRARSGAVLVLLAVVLPAVVLVWPQPSGATGNVLSGLARAILLLVGVVAAAHWWRRRLPRRPTRPVRPVLPPIGVPPEPQVVLDRSGPGGIAPGYLRWGEAVHAARLRQHERQDEVDAAHAAALAQYEGLLGAWQQRWATPEAERRRRGAQGAALTAVVAVVLVAALPSGSRPAAQLAVPVLGPVATTTSDWSATTSAERTDDRTDTTTTSAPADLNAFSSLSADPSLSTTSTTRQAATRAPVPKQLSDAAVLRPLVDCVGGVCTVLVRTDLISRPPGKTPTRTTVALVRHPDDVLGTAMEFVAVDAATRTVLRGRYGAPGGYSVSGADPGVGRFLKDRHDSLAMVLRFPAPNYGTPGEPPGPAGYSMFVFAVSDGELVDQADLSDLDQADSLDVLPLDRAGRVRWNVTSASSDPQVTSTFGWDASVDGYRPVQCAKSRNGDSVRYAPSGGTC